jgi:type I restriction enzyme S subunit
MSEWKECKLGDVSILTYGKMPLQKLIGQGSYIIFSGYKYQDIYPEYNCEVGDVILVARGVGGTGDVKLVKQKCYLTNLSIKIKLDNSVIDNSFFYYFFKKDSLRYLDSGSAQSQITIKDLSAETFVFPPLPEQKAIAEVLSSLDDKIDLLHRQNKTLEAMADELFRQWFEEPCKDGLPEGWTEGKLPDEFDFTMGQSPVGTSFNEDGIGMPMFQGNADFGFRFPSERIYTTEPTRYAEPFDTLVSVRAPVGEQNMALVKCCIGRGVAAFRYRNNKDHRTYTYFKIRSLIAEIKQFNDEGTVFGSIGKSDFEVLNIEIPPQLLIDNFQEVAKPIDDKVILNCKQIYNIEKLRDILLPRLMNGEVRVEG